jgi:Zn-dependent peptidase ImmA (M78 family)
VTWNGAALEFARREMGLTHAELIEKLGWGVQVATISRYENEARTPTPEQIQLLSDFFGVTNEYFAYPEAPHGALATEAHMRRQATERPVIWGRIEARLVTFRRHLAMLMRHTNFRPTYFVPRFDPLDVEPDEAARRVRAHWRVPIGPVESMVRLLEAAGCLVIEEDFGTKRIDGMSIWGNSWPVIYLNASMPTDRKRLTLAHELGHLVLHDNFPGEDAERDANRFAAEFLMPESTIAPLLKRTPLTLPNLASLKIEWKVSMQAIFERGLALGYANSDDRRKFYIAMNRKGWKVTEPNAGYIVEPAPRLISAIVGSMNGAGYSRSEIVELAGYQSRLPDVFDDAPRLRAV